MEWTQIPERPWGRGTSRASNPPHPALWRLDPLSTGLPATGRSISFKFFPKYLKFQLLS